MSTQMVYYFDVQHMQEVHRCARRLQENFLRVHSGTTPALVKRDCREGRGRG